MISPAKRLARLLDSAGQPTEAAVARYTEGDCWLLAFYLGTELDAPLVTVTDPVCSRWFDHVLADLGGERLLDVFGVATREETIARWSQRSEEPRALVELGRFHSFTEYLKQLDGVEHPYSWISESDEADARAVARAIADAYRLAESRTHT